MIHPGADLVISEIVPGLSLGTFDAAQATISDFVICVHENPVVLTTPNGRGAWIPIMESEGRASHGRLAAVATLIDAELLAGRRVLVHCHHGVERSPLAVAWFLTTKHGMTIDSAYRLVMERHPRTQDRRRWL